MGRRTTARRPRPVAHPPGEAESAAGRGASLCSAGRARLVADGGGLENRYGVMPIVGSNPTPSALTCGFRLSGLMQEPLRGLSAPVVPAACPYGFGSCPPQGGPARRPPRRLVALQRAGRSWPRAMRSGRRDASPRRAWLRSERPASSPHGGDRAGGLRAGRPSGGPCPRPRGRGGRAEWCRPAERTAGRSAAPDRATSGVSPAPRALGRQVDGPVTPDLRRSLLGARVSLDALTSHGHRARVQVDVLDA